MSDKDKEMTWGEELDALHEEDAKERDCSELDQMPGWQPIDTAPMDGTRILGATSYGVEMVKWVEEKSTVVGTYLDGWWGCEQDSGCKAERHCPYNGVRLATQQPTHWKPLPAPPTE